MQFIYSLLLVAFCGWAGVQAQNSLAQAKCRSLHHVDAESSSDYSNSNCLLNCVIHGRANLHNMNEGLACPLASFGTCRNGQCVQQSSTKLGFIDIEVIEGKVSEKVEAYTNVCIQNSSVPLSLPIQNRASCVTCTSNLASKSKEPKFNFVCADSNRRFFVSDARVSFEMWESKGSGAHNKRFLGGASLTIPQLLSHNDNHQKLKLALTGGVVSGEIKVRVTWTPRT